MSDIRVNERITIPAHELRWTFARSGGPGGQNVNKVNSKATLHWSPGRGTVPVSVWNRFRSLAKRYINTQGEIVIQSQEHRDQPQNVEACKSRLVALLRQASVVPRQRIKTKPTRASQRRRLDTKRQQSQKKQARRASDW